MNLEATIDGTATTSRLRGSSIARKLVLGRLERIESGRLTVQEPGGVHQFGKATDELSAAIRVHDPRFFGRLMRRGSIGAAETYMDGLWETDDLTALVRVLVRNQNVLQGMEGGLARLAAAPIRAWHALRRNSHVGSRKNISAHYDLDNEFFGLFLDETMTYSCGIFERPESSMREASVAKLDRLCRRLELSPEDHLLEIGTGWGALAIHAAREYGCRVTTTTISKEQYRFAKQRIEEAGLSGRIELLLEDYRNLSGQYDKLVSVEMIEAVGHHYYETFFKQCAGLLKPDGRMILQAITIADQHYERAKNAVDFIQRYIFPGSCIPSVTALNNAAVKSSDLRLHTLEDITPNYVRTLQEWRRKFWSNAEAIKARGFDDRFMRMWEFYLCYCEGGFAERHIGNVHMLFTKSGYRDEAVA